MSPTPPAVRSPPNKCPTVGGRADGGFLHYVHLLKPRNSMSITNTKGLLNMPGQNNCFLNSAVQVLWHLDIFRRSFRELGGHACMEDSCIFCALKELFAQFQYSQESALPPDALRRALAETFCDQRRFQLGFMDDAAECFENILMRIHFHIANNESEDMCSAVHCIPHQKFAMTLVEQTVCHACGATSEPLPFTQMVHYVPSSALCSQAKLMKEKNEPMASFSELLKKAGGLGDLRDCPSSCGAVIQIRKTLMNRPEIVSVGLVWDSERPTIEHIMDVFKTIGMSLKLQDVFHSVVDSRWASTATHQLVGIVTYYGKHYSTFFFHTKLRVWIYFDDAAVREIGPKWEQVVEKCCKGHFQPLLLLYANPHGTPVNTSTAPRIVTVVPGHKKNLNGKDVCTGNLSHEKHARMFPHQNNQRRALTPNPEMTTDMSANLQPRRAVTPSGEFTWWDENMKEQNGKKQETNSLHSTNFKDNATMPLSHTEGYLKYSCFPKNSELDHSNLNSTTLDCSTSLKNRLAARLSVPHLSFYHALRQSKSGTIDNGTINQPSEDTAKSILDSGINFQPPSNSDPSSKDSTYISRQAVENVLQLQKLQRQRSMNNKNDNPFVGQRNSSSSLESLDNVFAKGQASHLKFDVLDAANVARRRDSGNWSGDRNSASSSSTTSLDNPYFYNKRYPNARNLGRPGDTPSLTDAGYDSFSLSSSDSYPSAINNSPGKLDSRLGQIPENVQTAFVPYDISQLQYCLKELKNNEQFPFGFKDECDKLCAEADIFVAKSVERENVGDISMAALLSDTAAAKARAAMDVPYTNSQALAMAKMKHSMCLIRSSNLHKKLKEAEAVLRRMQKESLAEANRKDSPSGNRSTSDGMGFPKEEPENKSEDNVKPSKKSPKNSEESPKSDKNIEIYATLPKRSLKKKGALSSFVESLTGDESSEEKHKSSEEVRSSPTKKFDGNSSLSDRDEKPSKSPKGKKKSQTIHRTQNKDSELSDYSNEWEQTKKPALYRTYSGPTSNSKSELSDHNSGNQTFSDHPNKKQHRIRRKLMGGFMRRKNRSLPDLREGQDSGNETTRSYDDCFFTQIPTSCKKKQVNNTPAGSPSENNTTEQPNHTKSHKKNIIRAHTPPPYKPPPPITHSNLMNSPHKKSVQLANSDNAKPSSQINHPTSMRIQQENMIGQKVPHHPLLSRDSKSQRKLSTQPPPPDFATGSAVWLKELQLKQEEMNRRRKQEEERKRWVSECTSAADGNPAGLVKKDCVRDTANPNQTILSVDSNHHSTQSLPKLSYITYKGNSMANLENQKSVRDLTSKFETISFPSSVTIEASIDEKGRSVSVASPQILQEFYKQTESSYKHSHDNSEPELHRYTPSMNISSTPQDAPTKPADYPNKSAISDSKDRTFSSKMAYTTQAVAGSLYNPHLTDAQLTNVLRIGTNRSSFRNSSSNVDGHEDSVSYHTRDSCGMHDQRRPDKPPDYETALQRLEFLRHDRGLSKLYCSSGINFEAILEQAKKRKGPKKSVTFSDKVVLVACAGDEDNDFIPNPLLERVYKQHFMQKPNVQEPPSQTNAECASNSKIMKEGSVPDTSQSNNDSKVMDFIKSPQSPCNLCHKKTIESPNLYCPDCTFYMSRFQQK